MTPAPNPPPVAESVEQVAKKLAYAFSSDTMGDSLGVWWNGVSDQQRKRYIATTADILARHRAASHEAGRIAGVREGLEQAAKVAEGERPKNPVSDWTDYARTRDFAATTIAELIRALSKGEIDGE